MRHYHMLKVCLAVSRRKETWFEGYERTALNMGGSILVQILFCWWFIPISITRFIAMRTSKIPQWPDWVEQECKIAPGDPCVREAGYLYRPKKK